MDPKLTIALRSPPRGGRGFGRWALVCVLGGAFVALVTAATAGAQDGVARVLATTVDGPITPVIANHIGDGIDRAVDEDFDAYLIRLDTPGGLDSSMRDIVKDILAAEVPVIVYVSPEGARAASAGAIITFAAHVAAMAPATTIGAATPIAGDTGEDLEQKVINDATAYAESLARLRDRNVDFAADAVRDGRSADAEEAVELGVVDVLAASQDELLRVVDGGTVTVGEADREVVLRTADAVVVDHDMGLFRSIQQRLADPNLAFLFLSIGTLAIVYELASPGVGGGAVVGGIFIVLALFGLAVLEVNIAGLLLVALAVGLFVAEVFAPGIGVAAAGGAIALVLSGVFLVDDAPGLELSLGVLLPTAIVVGSAVIVAGRLAVRARRAPSATTGAGLFVDKQGEVRFMHGHPQTHIEGAWWNVRTPDGRPLAPGERVRVLALDGLDLIVEPLDAARPYRDGKERHE
jgi:membrane-bound serine protease (ClpP class)